MRVLALLALLMLANCQPKRVEVRPVIAPDFQYVRLQNGSYAVTAKTDEALKRAAREIGCPCVVEEWILWILTK